MTRRTAAGLKWSYLSAGISAIVQIAYVATMSRLLTPAAFGIVAMSQVVINFGQFFTRMGLAQTIIQKEDLSREDIRISATTGTLLGLICAGLVSFYAPQIASIYGEPQVVPVLRAMALTFILLGMSITSAGILRRQMRFRELAAIEVTSGILAAAAGVGAAFTGAGVWSLVVATIVSGVAALTLQYSRARHSLRPLLVWTRAKSLYGSGTRFSLLRVMEFLGRNLDTMAVGRYLSSSVTGVYSRAYTLVNMPLTRYLSMALVKVLFPGFAIIQRDRVRLRRAFRGLVTLASMVLLPVGAGMAVAAPELVQAVLGAQFTAAQVLVPPFVAAAVLFVFSHIAQLLCEAVGELNRTLAVQFLALASLAGLLLAVADAPAWAFAWALAVAEGVRHVAYVLLLRRTVGIRVRDVMMAYLPGLSAAAVVAGSTAVARGLLIEFAGAPVVLVLLVEMLTASAALAACMRWFRFGLFRQELWRRLRALGLGPNKRTWQARSIRAILGPPPEAHA